MPESQHLTWLGYLIAFVAAGGLLGYGRYWLEWRRAPVDRGYLVAQTDEIRARIRREDEGAAVAGLKELAEQLKNDRNHWRERAEVAETEVERMLQEQKARHKMVNELSAHRLRWQLLSQGVPLETVMSMPIEPIYEDAEGEGEA